MGRALDSAMIVQWGKETFGSEGTPVAATERCLVEEFNVQAIDEIARPRMHRGGLVRAQGDEFPVMRGTEFSVSGPLLFEQFHSWLALLLQGNVTPTGTGDNRSWEYDLTGTSYVAANACTFERRLTDAAGNHDDIEIPYSFLSQLTVTRPGDGPCTISGSGFGRRQDTSSTLTSLTGADAQPGVEYVVAPRTSLFIDDTNSWGSTQVSSKVLEFTLTINGGWYPQWTADNRTDLDWSFRAFNPENRGFDLEVTALIDTAGSANGDWATERAKAEAASGRFVRLFMEGRDIGTGTNTSLTFDLLGKHVPGSYAEVGVQDGQQIVTFRMQEAMNYTDDWITATVVNARSTLFDGTAAS